ncbi:hypothetical protein Clacol_010511 [Clathrus columnatus]|uniref:GDP/GTP exchange factor Sec2 N-terminal domain-containing protein n=1 Tax=Clathrus columnatus TaxID=1419009 RepID=A0AAV5ANZ7_9AGAM|nr:hypothetical protein Clacol_010511 [Clathrus columnatus]
MDTAAPAATTTPPPLPPRAERRKKTLPPPTPKTLTPNTPPANLTSPIVQAAQDVEHARRLLEGPIVDENMDDTEKEIHKMVREKEVTQLLMRMTDWVEELSSLLQRSYNKEAELETTLTLAQTNLQMVHANNELEESAGKLGTNGSTLRDFGWRPWSKRDSRRSADGEANIEDTLTPLPKPQSPRNSIPPSASSSNLSLTSQPVSTPPSTSRFFNFSSLTRNSTTSVISTPPSESASPPKPTQREKELAQELEKERTSRQKVIAEKAALESELETLSQALFEQANKMVSNSNRKLAEIEEELRIAMEEREALKSTLRVIASHSHTRPNDDLRPQVSVDVSGFSHREADPSTPRASSIPSSTTSSLIFEHDLSPTTPHPKRANRVNGEDKHEDEDDEDDDDKVSSSPTDYSGEKEKEFDVKDEEEDAQLTSGSSLPPHPVPSAVEQVNEESLITEGTAVAQKEDTEEHIEPRSTQTMDENMASATPEESSSGGPRSTLLPDAVLGSPVSQYTMDSIHQSI